MARKSTNVPVIESKQFAADEIDRGIAKLRRRIEEVRSLEKDNVTLDDPRVRTAETNIRETVRSVFGPNSPEFHDHQYHDIWHGGYNMMDTERDRQRKFMAGIPQTAGMLEGLIGRIEEAREELGVLPTPGAKSRPVMAASEDGSVFLVHGHDQAATEATARFLETLGLRPVVLSEEPDRGRTIIEKFEQNSDVHFAVVLMTPDDIGHQREKPENARPRARQNVILELGYFVGKLSRSRVAVLYRGDVEIPSDYHGVVYIHMDERHGWKLALARELKAAGLDIDLNKAI